jgi:hypothetical protein
MKLSLIAIASTFVLAAGAANAATVVVPGTSDPFLAGAAAGNSVTFSSGDTDTFTADSPVAYAVTAGEVLTIAAVTDPTLGRVDNCPGCTNTGNISSEAFTAHGFTALVSGFQSLQINSLVGLFNDASPAVFEIGSGNTYVVPTGATTLYLGTVDSYQWSNNVGAYDVTLSAVSAAVPEPATWAMMLFGIGGIGATMRMARRKSGVALAAV